MSEHHYYVVELDLPEVVGTCTSGGVNGYSTPLTCTDQTDPTTEIKTHYFTNTALTLIDSDIYKCVDKVAETMPKLKAGNGLGSMATATITLRDFKGDPNPDSPAVISNDSIIEQGTFFGKLKARNIVSNKQVRVKYYVRNSQNQDELIKTHKYIANDFKSTGKDTWRLVCKDVLYKADEESSQFPSVTTGRLLSGLSDSQTTISFEGDIADWTDYEKYVAVINKEIMRINSATGTSTQVNLIVDRTASLNVGSRLILNTVDTHTAGDEVFRGRIFENANLYEVIEAALLDANMSTSEFDGYEMKTELALWLGNLTNSIDCVFYESTATKTFLDNICKIFLLDIYSDVESGMLKLRANSPWNKTAQILKEGEEIIYGSVDVDEQKDLYHSRAFLQYDKRALTESDDDTNFSRSSLAINTDLEGELFYNDEKVKKIGKSIILSNKLDNIESSDLTVSRSVQRWSNRPEKISFKIEEKNLNFKLSDVVEIDSDQLQDETGANRQNVRAQVVSITPSSNIGRTYKIGCLTYNPFIGGISGSDITINSQFDINLFTQAGGPVSANNFTFLFDGGVYGQNQLSQAITIGSFPSGSTVNIVLLNGAILVGKGGNGGNGANANEGNNTAVIGQNGTDGGTTILGEPGVTVNIYVNGDTGDLGNGSYNADGYLYAAGGGGAGGTADRGIEENNALGGTGGSAGAGFLSGTNGTNGQTANAGGLEPQNIGGSGGGYGEAGGDAAHPTLAATGGSAGKAIVLNGGSINVLSSGDDTRFIQGIGDTPSTLQTQNLEMFANENIRTPVDTYTSLPTAVYKGDPLLPIDQSLVNPNPLATTELYDGTSVTFHENGSLVFSPNGVYDDLDVGQNRTAIIPVSLDPLVEAADGPDIYDDTFYDQNVGGSTYNPNDSNAWVSQGNRWYTINPEAQQFVTETRRFITPNLIAGKVYAFTMSFRDSTVVNDKRGLVEFFLVDSSGDTIGGRLNESEDPSNQTGFTATFECPSNYFAIRMRARTFTTGTVLDWRIDSINEVSNVHDGSFYDNTAWGFEYDSNDSNNWLEQSDGWYTINPEEQEFVTETRRFIRPAFEENQYYVFKMSFRDSTVVNDKRGLVEFFLIDINGDTIGGSLNDSEDPSNQTGFEKIFQATSNVYAIRLRARTFTTGTVLDWKIDHVKKLEISSLNTTEFNLKVKGSEQVSAKLIGTDSLSGVGWTKNGSVYTHTNGTDPLAATVETDIDSVLEIQLKTQNTSAGSVSVTSEYSTLLNEGDCWYIRAESEDQLIEITPTSDFDGDVKDVFIREVITETYAADIEKLVFTDLEETGSAQIKWLIEPVAERPSKTTDAQYVYKNIDNFKRHDDYDDYVLRWGDGGDAYVENIYYSGTRNGISPNGGSSRVEFWDVRMHGGYTDNGIVGDSLISKVDNIFSGTGWTFDGWGSYSKSAGNSNILSMDISGLDLVEGEVVEVTMHYQLESRIYSPVGSVTPRMQNGTVINGVKQTSVKPFDIYYFTVPANLQTLEFVPSTDFEGSIQRLYLSRVLKSPKNSTVTAQFQNGYGNSNQDLGSNVIEALIYYFHGNGLNFPVSYSAYDFTNTDGLVFNRETFDTNVFETSAFVLGANISWWSDGCIDGKTSVCLNNSTLSYAHRLFRAHEFSHHISVNNTLYRHGNTQGAFHTDKYTSRYMVHNSYVDDVRCVSKNQMLEQTKEFALSHINAGSWLYDGSISEGDPEAQLHVSHTIPRYDNRAKLACTDMDFEYTESGQRNWASLNLDKVGLPSPSGVTQREFSLPAGVYDFRVRCKNGRYTGDWKFIHAQSIS